MGNVKAGYDDIGTKCLGHAQPGTVALSEAMRARWHHPSDGIYNCRPKRGSSSLSAHGEGRAYDDEETDEADGRTVCDFLIANNAELGIQVVIFWDKIWSYPHRDEGFRPYHGADNHHGHIHVEQNWSGAKFLTRAAADKVIAKHPDPLPRHPQEDDMPARIYRSDDDQDPSEVFVDGGGLVVVIADGKDRAIFTAPPINAEVVSPLTPTQYAAIKARATQ